MKGKPPTSRIARLARLGGLTTRVSGRYVGERIAGLFRDEEARARALRRLHVENAERVVEAMEALKGAAMKVGQTASMLVDSVDLPPEVGRALARLENRAEPVPFDVVRARIEEELEAPLGELFAELDPEPIGTASLAQAHAGRLPDGTAVVVKVLHPDIERAISADLLALRSLLAAGRGLGRPRTEMDAAYEEIRARLEEEVDYYQEAANIELFAEHLAGRPGVFAPRTHPRWCARHVLTMDRVPGRPLREFVAHAAPEARQRAGRLLVETFYDTLFRLGAIHADPHPGNYLFTDEGDLGLVDFGCVRRYDVFFRAAYGRVGLAILDGRRDETLEIARDLGILVGRDPEAEELLWRFCRTMTEPLWKGRFRCGGPEDDVLERLRRIVRPMLRRRDIRNPREFVFLHRTLAGVFTALGRLRHEDDYGAIFRRYAAEAVAAAR